MTDVNVEYDKSKVSMLSNVDFPYISKGKEMVVSGKLNDFSIDIDQATGAMDMKYNIKGKVSLRKIRTKKNLVKLFTFSSFFILLSCTKS